jgi:hypothetical protein
VCFLGGGCNVYSVGFWSAQTAVFAILDTFNQRFHSSGSFFLHSMMIANVRELYGGAMRIMLCSRFQDLSDFRLIPDHQEVFSDANTDQSVIVEINEMLQDVVDLDIPR